ncbi:MAG TPA: hypothetical protein VF733_00775 [Candidatus Saccharimonadales bacterium]
MKTIRRIAHLQPFEPVGLGHYQDPINEAQIPLDVFTLDGDMPNLDHYDAVAMSGGPQSVNDAELEPMVDAVREAHNREIPVLGSCLGGQAIGKAIGMRVVDATRHEYGFGRVRLTDDGRTSKLLQGVPDIFGTFQAHNEMILNDPKTQHDIKVLAEGGGMIQSMQAGETSFVMQSHPELPLADVNDWADNVPQLTVMNRQILYQRFVLAYPRHRHIAQTIMRNFLDIVAERR